MICKKEKELYPIVDENDNVISWCDNKEVLHTDKHFHRGVHIFIERPRTKSNTAGFVLQLKKVCTENGGKWSSAVSGHVLYGETYEQAAIRELQEEIGIKIDTNELVYVLSLQPNDENGYEFVRLYSYLLGCEQLEPNADELDSLVIYPRKDVEFMIKNKPDLFSPVFRTLFDIFIVS